MNLKSFRVIYVLPALFLFLNSCAMTKPSKQLFQEPSQCQLILEQKSDELAKAFVYQFELAVNSSGIKKGTLLSLAFVGEDNKQSLIRKDIRPAIINSLLKKGYKVLERENDVLIQLAFEESGRNVRFIAPSAITNNALPDNALATSEYTVSVEILCQNRFVVKGKASAIVGNMLNQKPNAVEINSIISFVNSVSGEIIWIDKQNLSTADNSLF